MPAVPENTPSGSDVSLFGQKTRQVLAPKMIDLNRAVSDMGKLLRRLIGEDIDLVTVLASGITFVCLLRRQARAILVMAHYLS